LIIKTYYYTHLKKNKANTKEEYSTLNPATSSASASGKSNGVRLVSAKIVIINKIKIGNKGNANQIPVVA
jgi:hypothetical protein